jgi:hypothetical protein
LLFFICKKEEKDKKKVFTICSRQELWGFLCKFFLATEDSMAKQRFS